MIHPHYVETLVPLRYLRCLGQPALFSPSGEPIRFRTKKHLALLVYLAVEAQRRHRRDRLAELLWPTVPMAEARHSLATALSILRPRLGPDGLETDREQVLLNAKSLTLDLDRLARGEVLGTETSAPLEVAAFLDGFEIRDAGEFSLWKDRQQARLLPAIKSALIVLIDRCRRTGDSRQIEQLADRMLALDDLSEEAIRAKMEARAFAGDRLTALKIFEEWKAKLAEAVGAVPSESLEGMASSLRGKGWARAQLSNIPAPPSDQLRTHPFVGRSEEYQALYEAWERLEKGNSSLAFVVGDSGVGKTTLVERVTMAASLEGAVISRVQCYDLEREIPYAALEGLARGLLDRPGVSATPPEALAELARIVPEVRHRFPCIPAPTETHGETARIRLTEAFHEMLKAVADEHPVILVVDNVHVADEASLAVLHLVLRLSRGQRVMTVLISRPGELSQSPQAARLRESAAPLGMHEVELAPLSVDECGQLLSSLIPTDQPQPSSSARRTLIRVSGGFPMVLELLVQDWQANGDRCFGLAMDAMTSDLDSMGDLTAAYRRLLTHIVQGLDTATQSALSLAAVLGHRLNELEMYDVIDISLGQTMAALGQLSKVRILRDGTSGLEFINELVRAHAYANTPASVRRALHGAVAERLLRGRHPAELAPGLEIAWHCMRAGRVEQATTHLLRGAREAIRHGGPQAVERALSSALPYLIGDDKHQALLLLAEALQEQGRWQESLDFMTEFGGSASNETSDDSFVLKALAKLKLGTSRARELIEEIPHLASIIGGDGTLSARVRAARAAAYVALEYRDRDLARRLFALVDTVEIDQLDIDLAGQLALAAALLLDLTGDLAGSLNRVTAGLEHLKRRGAANLVAVQMQNGMGTLMTRQGRYEEAASCCEEALAMASRLGNDSQRAHIIGNLALCYCRLGRYEEQAELVTSAAQALGPRFSGFLDIQIAYCTALGHAMRGRNEQALGAINRADDRLVGPIPGWMLQAWSLWKADILAVIGRRGEAISSAREAGLRLGWRLQSPGFAGPFARWSAAVFASTGDLLGAQRIIDPLSKEIETFDEIDQLEILCAKYYLGSLDGRTALDCQAKISTKLLDLPPAIAGQLAAMGFLPKH